MNAIDFLNDLEAKADAATPGTWKQKETEQCGLFPLVLSEKNGIKYNVARTGVISFLRRAMLLRCRIHRRRKPGDGETTCNDDQRFSRWVRM